MTAADRIDQQFAKLLVADADGGISHLPRAALASLFQPGDLVVANDAATLPASLQACTAQPANQSRRGSRVGYPFAIPRALSRSSSAPAIIAS